MGSACSTVNSAAGSRTGTTHLTDGSSSNNPLRAHGSSMDSRAVGVTAQPLRSSSTAATASDRREHQNNKPQAPHPRRFMLLSVGSPTEASHSSGRECGGLDDDRAVQQPAPSSGSSATPLPHCKAAGPVALGSGTCASEGEAWLEDELEEAYANEAATRGDHRDKRLSEQQQPGQYLAQVMNRLPARSTRQSQAGASQRSLSQGGQLLDALAMDLVSVGGDLSTRTIKKWQNGEPVASVLPVPSEEEESGMLELPVEKSHSRNAMWIGDAPGAQVLLARHGVAGGLFTSFQGDSQMVATVRPGNGNEKQLSNSLSCKPRDSSKSGSATTGDLSVASSSALPPPQIAVSNFML